MSLLHALDLIGVAVFAVSGALTAGRHRLDLLGVVIIATITAIGGGTLRDVLLNRDQVFWIADPTYLYVIVVAAVLTIPYVRLAPIPEKTLQIADALGLGLFAVAGGQVAEARGVSAPIIVAMGVVTGVAGGMLRDVLCNEVPMILRKGSLYATCVIIGMLAYIAAKQVGLPRGQATLIGSLTIIGVRLGAITWGWSLPEFHLPPGERRRR